MNFDHLDIVLTGTGLTAALVAGVFLTFSELVMDALGRLDEPSGIKGMQRINRRVFRTIFLFSALGLVPVMGGLSFISWNQLEGSSRMLVIAGSLTYLIGMFGVTMFGNVPMNEKLAQMMPEALEACEYWHYYLKVWTRWNHLRTASSFVAGGLYLLAPLAGA